ncbi:ankyrin repeat domain-containing protein [Saprospiraceae bacterium]|nr:ankyrin repeat domain-containing protein [Saprospiraceae bacterium]
MADFLLQKGANINSTDSEGSSLLSYAIMVNNIDFVDFLIRNKVNKTLKASNTSMGCFPIHSCESLEMLVKLELEGFDLNLVCDNGMNLLHFSIEENFDDISKYLITNNLVNKAQMDKDGLTPLDYAIKYKNQDIQKMLKS